MRKFFSYMFHLDKKPSKIIFFKTFGALICAFGLTVVALSLILKPQMREDGFVVHMSVDLIQDMLNANLRGRSLNEISKFLAGCNEGFLRNAQIATVGELFSPHAPQHLGIFLREHEQLRILDGEAFWTGKPFGPNINPPPPPTHLFPIPDIVNNDENFPNDFPPPPPGLHHRHSMHNDRMPGPHPGEMPHPRPHHLPPGGFTVYSLVHYTATIMEPDHHLPPNFMKRSSFIVIPIENTSYVVFARRPAPLPPELSKTSLIFGTFVLIAILIFTALTLILPTVIRIRKIEDVCQKVAHGDYDARCLDKRSDSLGILAQHVDEMTLSIKRHLGQQKSLLQAVSHELRTPLSRIRFTIEMLDIDEDDEKSMARIDSIDEDLTEIDNLIKELGYFNYVDAGNGRQHFELLAVKELIDATVHQRSHAIDNLELTVNGVTDDMCLEADPTAFKRVIGNLLSNAARYAKSKIIISAEYSKDKKSIYISVEDDGSGIPVEKRDSIFEPFVCLEESRSKSMTGCGLGLAIAHRIMKIHAGSIEVQDSVLGGTKMFTSWPISHD